MVESVLGEALRDIQRLPHVPITVGEAEDIDTTSVGLPNEVGDRHTATHIEPLWEAQLPDRTIHGRG